MTLTEVRNALILIAQKSKRPPYEIYIAKEVHRAIQNGTDHPLLDHVLNTGFSPTPLSESNHYSDVMALRLDHWISAKRNRKNVLIEKLNIKPEFLFDLRFGLIRSTHPIWPEVEAAMRELGN
ncbi:TPA: hypothetical protein JI393_RS14370 [Acinetobacter baumannii]|nr:hypothetical protein [Acinetobacter baumannii]HBI9064021.1 hypothetical protein [Acinetobacter baumannii]